MDWIFDNLQFVIIVATTIAWWLNQRREAAKAEREEEEARRHGTEEPPPFDFDEDMDEHARRVQEDIRRKIAERRGEGLPASPLETLFEPAERKLETAFEEPPPVPVPVSAPTARAEAEWGTEDAGALERHRKLDEELARLQRQQQQAERRARDVGVSATGGLATTPTAAGAYAMTAFTGSMRRADAHWLKTLRDPREARKAIVLRELLGPPVGLRE